jgi:tRNA modification GTPase
MPHAAPAHPSATTIAAVATPAGVGAVAMVRISGPEAFAVAERATGGRVTAAAPPRTALHRRILDEAGRTLDDGLLTLFPAPHSFTAENCVEYTGHGGLLVTREVLARFLACGAVPAGPGEFTQRAFLNGKLDLTQAEGVMDLISAQTRLALRAARGQLDGVLGRRTTAARDRLLEILAHLEAWIDFPEEDIHPQAGAELVAGLRDLVATIDSMLATADQGRVLREGVRTVICGPPNVGKSSLLNRLLGCDRAIVSATPGTTRDTIEETISLDGIPLRLVDTAGVRTPADALESAGIARTLRQLDNADLVLDTADASVPPPPPMTAAAASAVQLRVLNKCDLGEHPAWSGVPAVRISCASGQGFDGLAAAIRDSLHFGASDWGEHSVAINARHQASLRHARDALAAAIDLLAIPGHPPELAAIDLREALDALGEIPGKLDADDLLGAVFSRFCIGK